MLTDPQHQPRRRQQQSLRQEYEEFILQRIEEFKEQISREDLLAIADEAVRELEVGPEEQLVLTEVLVLEHVDRLIMRRLSLPKFRRWRDHHVKRRRAQREPTHWGLEPETPLCRFADRVRDDGVALVVGKRVTPAAFYLAAHEWPVLFIDHDLTSVEAAETRAAAESLSMRFQGLVVSIGNWFPDVDPTLAVLDGTLLSQLDTPERDRFLEALKGRTRTGGTHCLVPVEGKGSILPFSPETLRARYAGWRVERARSGDGAPRWFLAVKR